MAKNCIMKNDPAFEEYAEGKDIEKGRLYADVVNWQSKNNTDALPTLEQMYGKDFVDSRETNEFKKTFSQDLTNLKGVRRALMNTIELQLRPLRKFKFDENTKKLEEFKDTLIEIQDILNDYDNTEHPAAVLAYLQKAGILLDNMETQISKMKNSNVDISNVNKKQLKFQLGIVHIYETTLKNFDLINEIKNELDGTTLPRDEDFVNYENKGQLIDHINSLNSRLDTAKAETLAISKPRLAAIMAPYSNFKRVEREEELERQFRRNNKGKTFESNAQFQSEMSKYIADMMSQDGPIDKASYDYFLKRFDSAGVDISFFSAMANSELDINNVTIQTVSKVLEDVDFIKQSNMLEIKNRVYDIVKKAKLSGQDPETMYKGFYVKASDGNVYLTTEYSPEFFIEYDKLRNKLDKLGETSTISEEYKKQEEINKEWYQNNIKAGKPIAKWKDSNYTKLKDNELYQELINLSFASDTKTEGNQSNVISKLKGTVTFHQVPNISKQGYEELVSGNIFTNIADNAKRLVRSDQADTTEYGMQPLNLADYKTRKKEINKEIRRRVKNNEPIDELKDELNMLSVLTDSTGDIKKQVPIFFRGNNNQKTQSYDLASIYLMDAYMAENFAQKMKVKETLELLLNVVKHSKFTQTQGMQKKVIVSMFGENVYNEVRKKQGDNSNVYKVLESIIDNRLYGIKTIGGEFNQFAQTLMSYSAMTMLGLNYLAGAANIAQGKTMNFIESVGAEYFNAKNLQKGEIAFWADAKNWMGEAGNPMKLSKTSVLLEYFDVQGEFKPFKNRLNQDKRYKSMMNKNNLFFINHIGEFYMHGTLMYSILNNIKIKNKNNEYIDQAGKVVPKEKAMSLDEAMDVDSKGNPTLHKDAAYTSFGNQKLSLDIENDKALTEVRLLVGKLAHDLHGNYKEEIKSMSQRHVFWQMIQMLRKWIVPGFNRRFRGMTNAGKPVEQLDEKDRFYSESLQNFQEGHYTTLVRFLYGTFKSVREMGLQEALSSSTNGLTNAERANMKRTGAELATMTLMMLTTLMLEALAGGDIDEDDEKALLYGAFFSERLYTELSFFVNPLSTLQIMASPAASVSYLEDAVQLGQQMLSDTFRVMDGEGLERYERTRRKGMSKLYKRTTDVLPIFNILDSNVYEKYSYLANTNN